MTILVLLCAAGAIAFAIFNAYSISKLKKEIKQLEDEKPEDQDG